MTDKNDIANMKNDITVQEIIASFQGINRPEIYSSADSDKFLDLLKNKKHWTLEEYKDFSLAYDLQYMHRRAMDFMRLQPLEKKNGFTLSWEYYFKVIESIEDKETQKKYINYYFWYHASDMNEDIFKQLMLKPYYGDIESKTKVTFLQHSIKTDKPNAWFDQYFTQDEIKEGLVKNSLHINIYDNSSANNISKEKEEVVKVFYNHYEKIMDNKTKVKFLKEIVRTGSLDLIKFIYVDKKVKRINKMHLFWSICSDIAFGNPLEILHYFKQLGMKFEEKDLIKTKEHSQWGYMENTEQLEHFFKVLEVENKYNILDKKFPQKSTTEKKLKI